MKYESTRGRAKKVAAAYAIKLGIAPDGGLYVPDKIAHIDYYKYINMTYQQRAFHIIREYLPDFDDSEIIECIENAYNADNFDIDSIVKTTMLTKNMGILELWHGPTYAFKDLALQILPYFLTKAVRKTGEKKDVLILVATSGDTGKAALEGFKDIEGVDIIVFFPTDGVSSMQKLQMVTQEGKNLKVINVDGNFDDAQSAVKDVFIDNDIISIAKDNGLLFSSANSINWGRLLPQVVYYVSAYADMVKDGHIQDGEKINICIPTGNFGNILAAYYAKAMGLPVNRLICASNENNILTDFIITGIYNTNREFVKTISPSMDILVSSNLERLLYEMTGRNSKQVTHWMQELKANGVYEVDDKTKKKLKEVFFAGFCSDKDTFATISDIYDKFGYLVDPHTAVAIDVYDKYIVSTQDLSKTLIASTASPFKFPESVAQAVLGPEAAPFNSVSRLLKLLSEKTGIDIPAGLKGLEDRKILHDKVCGKNEIAEAVLDYITGRGDRGRK